MTLWPFSLIMRSTIDNCFTFFSRARCFVDHAHSKLVARVSTIKAALFVLAVVLEIMIVIIPSDRQFSDLTKSGLGIGFALFY